MQACGVPLPVGRLTRNLRLVSRAVIAGTAGEATAGAVDTAAPAPAPAADNACPRSPVSAMSAALAHARP